MRLLFIGDIVGSPADVRRARAAGADRAREDRSGDRQRRERRQRLRADADLYRKLREAGVDLVTLGDHIYKKAGNHLHAGEGRTHLQARQLSPRCPRPRLRPGHGPRRHRWPRSACWAGPSCAAWTVPSGGRSRVGRLAGQARCIVVDAHAEATADKYLLGHHLKGRVSAVLGTHTHVPTADEQILPGGTAFISDVGMTGPYDSILGRRIDRVLPDHGHLCSQRLRRGQRRPAPGRRHRGHGSGHRPRQAIRRYQLDEVGLAQLPSTTRQ